MPVATSSVVLNSKWQRVGDENTSSITISARSFGGAIQPVEVYVGDAEIDADLQTEAYILAKDSLTLSGLSGEYVYVRQRSSMATHIGILTTTQAPV